MLKTLCTFVKDNQLSLTSVPAAQEQPPGHNLIWKLNRTIRNKRKSALRDTS